METRVVLGVALLAVQAAIIVPLAVELRKTRSARGISVISETAWIIAGVGWSIYGYLTGSVTLIASGALATLGSLTVYSLIFNDVEKEERNRSFVLGVVFCVFMLTTTAAAGATGLAVFLSVFGLVQFLPQLRTSIIDIKAKTGVGVPLAGTALRALYTLTWAVYAAAWFLWGISFGEIDWPLAVWGACGFVAFSLQFIAGLVSRQETSAGSPC